MSVRRLLHHRGLRYRVNARPVPTSRRTADIMFISARVVILIDGCFFHGCPQHYVEPKTRTQFWAEKIAGNIARDLETTVLFEEAGWTVLRFWEHEDPGWIAARAEEAVESGVRDRRTRVGTQPPADTPRLRDGESGRTPRRSVL
jgi:DNA mismatch endonuclease (patch repair protein)